ncbi:MAG: hypothetical protein AAF471_08785, partial [Myxococcota bacterium]
MKYRIWTTALAGFLALSGGCTGGGGNTLPEGEGGSETNHQAGGKGNNGTEPTKPETSLAFSCKDVPVEQCDEKFFGEQRCEKSGQTCVELQEPITFTTKRCDELNADDCGKSVLCQLKGNACEDRQYVFEPPCKDEGEDSCLAKNKTCLFDSIIQRCGKNPYGGRCVFDGTKCTLNVTGDDCADAHGGACRKVEVPDGIECKLNARVCGNFKGNLTLADIKIQDAAAATTSTHSICTTNPTGNAQDGGVENVKAILANRPCHEVY